jgi:hypothetical protein
MTRNSSSTCLWGCMGFKNVNELWVLGKSCLYNQVQYHGLFNAKKKYVNIISFHRSTRG